MFQESSEIAEDIFSKGPTTIKPRSQEFVDDTVPVGEIQEEKPYMSKNLSIAQIKEREERTIFVGNVELETKRKHLKKFFTPYGDVEQVWLRSVPVEHASKMPRKGLIALNKFAENADSKNAYVLFKEKESVEKACEANNSEFRSKHLRVTPANKKELDTKTTIFVGNLSFSAKEEELRTHFSTCGRVDMVRIIKEKGTNRGKGIAYIKFAHKEAFLKALKLNMTTYMDRELRIKKAISVELEKKMRFKRQAVAVKRRKLNSGPATDSDIKMNVLQNFAKNANTDNDMTAERMEAIFTHRGVVPQSMVGKKIKKLKKKGLAQADMVSTVNKIKKAAHVRLERDVLAKGDQMKQRAVKRKLDKERNVKKANSYKKKAIKNEKAPKIKKVTIS